MKTIKLLICTLGLFLVKNTPALNSSSSFTLTNPCLPQVTITPIANTYGCFSLTASSGVPNDPDAYYQWHFQDGTIGYGKTIYHCCSPVTVTTNYTLSLTYNNPNIVCVPMSFVQVFTITLNPPASTLCVNNTPSVTLAANSVTVWAGVAIPEIFTNFVYGDSPQPTTNYTHTYANCGNYIIKVNQWNMNTPNDTCFAYAAININCNGPNAIKDNQQKNTTVFYPNPAKDVLTIKTELPINSVMIYDVLGKGIFVLANIKNTESKIYLKDFVPGTYFTTIYFDDGSRANIKFIKE